VASPVISIITVCFNASETIEDTVKSVVAQSWRNIEYVIIDGASTDGSLEIIEKYRNHVTKLLSEEDEGLYDAMNKGLQHATGDYVLFLNADDTLYAPDTLEKAFMKCKEADVIYGEAMFVDAEGNELGLRSACTPHRVPEHLNWKSLKYGMVVSHQAFIIRRDLAKTFDLRYPICADIDWMIASLKECKTNCKTQFIISRFRVGGISKQSQRKAWKERYRVLARHYGMLPNFFAHLYIAIRYLFSKKY